MPEVIVYNHGAENGTNVAIIHPSDEILAVFTVSQVAAAIVPEGLPYKIMDRADLPDRATRDLWRVDDADLTDGFGGAHNTPGEASS